MPCHMSLLQHPDCDTSACCSFRLAAASTDFFNETTMSVQCVCDMDTGRVASPVTLDSRRTSAPEIAERVVPAFIAAVICSLILLALCSFRVARGPIGKARPSFIISQSLLKQHCRAVLTCDALWLRNHVQSVRSRMRSLLLSWRCALQGYGPRVKLTSGKSAFLIWLGVGTCILHLLFPMLSGALLAAAGPTVKRALDRLTGGVHDQVLHPSTCRLRLMRFYCLVTSNRVP
jgi:hypothetical protein